MYAEIKTALDSVKVISDILKASKELREFNELSSAISELNTKLLSATSAALESKERELFLSNRVSLLEKEIMKFENWETQAKDYTLQSVGALRIHFAQVYKPAVDSPKERHWACPKCFQEKKLYVFSAANSRFSYKCANCGNEISPIITGGGIAPIDSAY